MGRSADGGADLGSPWRRRNGIRHSAGGQDAFEKINNRRVDGTTLSRRRLRASSAELSKKLL